MSEFTDLQKLAAEIGLNLYMVTDPENITSYQLTSKSMDHNWIYCRSYLLNDISVYLRGFIDGGSRSWVLSLKGKGDR